MYPNRLFFTAATAVTRILLSFDFRLPQIDNSRTPPHELSGHGELSDHGSIEQRC
uniref:Uncharacterized protein n=1 Tax=Helianthus annuus TaxID=4232 RepID=A0A251T4A9_HELAN